MRITMAMAEAEVSVMTFDLKTFHNMASIKKRVRVIKTFCSSANPYYLTRICS